MWGGGKQWPASAAKKSIITKVPIVPSARGDFHPYCRVLGGTPVVLFPVAMVLDTTISS